MKILMVCLGNICRSPLAEGIMKQKIQQQSLDWEVDSAGTGFWHIGSSPDPRSIRIAHKYNIDIKDQRARQIKLRDLDEFDMILAMDIQNYKDILSLAKNEKQKQHVKLIMDFVFPNQQINVPDPYYDDNSFEKVFKMLDAACDAIITTGK